MKHTRQNPITKSITATRVPITTPRRNGVWKIYSTQSLRSHESKVRLESNNSSPVTCPGKFKITMLDMFWGQFVNFLLKPSISDVEGSGTLSTKIFWSLVAIPKMKVFFSFWNTVCACFKWERPIKKLQIYYQPVDPDEKFAMISAASTDCDSLKNCWSNYTNKTLFAKS